MNNRRDLSLHWRKVQAAWWAMFFVLTAEAGLSNTLYVSATGSHQAPYSNWLTAATDIQAAINAAADGDTIWVADGTYETGEARIYGRNRIAITKPIAVRSANGPAHTVIRGSGPADSPSAVRCAYVGEGARLDGFTLTGGHTNSEGVEHLDERNGGGALCETSATVSNCIIRENSAYGSGSGGGVYRGTVVSCVISGNEAMDGGGAYDAMVRDCFIKGNVAHYSGGGVSHGSVQDSTISGNEANDGGGTSWSTARNCFISANKARSSGGGAHRGLIESCTISGNHCIYPDGGGGVSQGGIRNCIVYYNTMSPANYTGQRVENNYPASFPGAFTYTCTTPDPGGEGNITTAPGLVHLGDPYIVENSPCVDAGSNEAWMLTEKDVEGELRIHHGTVDMGCDEVHGDGLLGTLSVAVRSDYRAVVLGYPIRFEADIQGRPTEYQWSWGNGESTFNTHSMIVEYVTPGDYQVVLQARNLNGMISVTQEVQVLSSYTNYVSPSGNHVAPYESWNTAATNIQVAIEDHAVLGGSVLVSNGVYDTGGAIAVGSLASRIAITRPLTVRSVNGPRHTIIVGEGPLGDSAVRCAYVCNGSSLEGFTLTNGHTRITDDLGLPVAAGGGVFCEPTALVSNCHIRGNTAYRNGGGVYRGVVWNCLITDNEAGGGGGTYDSTLQDCFVSANTASSGGGGTSFGTAINCVIAGNSVTYNAGGAYFGTLRNCTVTGNTAGIGGGIHQSTVRNCIVYHNTARGTDDDNYYNAAVVEYTCIIPDPGGVGNITDDPQFADTGALDVHLLSTSPCIDAGTREAWMAAATDVDGLPRIVHGRVDMGAYEWPHMVVSDIRRPTLSEGPIITWASFSNAHYAVYGSTNLAHGYDILLKEHIPAQPPNNAYTGTVNGVTFRGYRVEYQP